jgi:predicted acetyltransferase
MSKLILPSKKYIKGNIANIKELYKKSEISLKEFSKEIEKRKNVNLFLGWLKDQRNGINIEKGRVQSTTYWLVDNEEYIGRLNLRKKLNKKLRIRGGNIGYEIRPLMRGRGYGIEILRLGLLKAKKEGFKKIFIDCREDNIASKKIIETNGGVFRDKLEIKGEGAPSLRYYIDIK